LRHQKHLIESKTFSDDVKKNDSITLKINQPKYQYCQYFRSFYQKKIPTLQPKWM